MSRRKVRQPEAEVFGATIRRLREERGSTQEELSERASMKRQPLPRHRTAVFVIGRNVVPRLPIYLQT